MPNHYYETNLVRRRENMEERRQRLRDAGLCTRCGREPAIPGARQKYTTCAACLEKQRAYSRKSEQRRRRRAALEALRREEER